MVITVWIFGILDISFMEAVAGMRLHAVINSKNAVTKLCNQLNRMHLNGIALTSWMKKAKNTGMKISKRNKGFIRNVRISDIIIPL